MTVYRPALAIQRPPASRQAAPWATLSQHTQCLSQQREATHRCPGPGGTRSQTAPRSTTDELQEAIFASQGDAESWLGENWRGLLAAGVDQVSLLDDTRTEYGPMSLHPAD